MLSVSGARTQDKELNHVMLWTSLDSRHTNIEKIKKHLKPKFKKQVMQKSTMQAEESCIPTYPSRNSRTKSRSLQRLPARQPQWNFFKLTSQTHLRCSIHNPKTILSDRWHSASACLLQMWCENHCKCEIWKFWTNWCGIHTTKHVTVCKPIFVINFKLPDQSSLFLSQGTFQLNVSDLQLLDTFTFLFWMVVNNVMLQF